MAFSATLFLLETEHLAWRLLPSSHAPLVANLLHRVFVAPRADLARGAGDNLVVFPKQVGVKSYPNGALGRLNRIKEKLT